MTDAWGTPREVLAWNCRCSSHPTTLEIIERWVISEVDDPFENVAAKCTTCQMPFLLRRDGIPVDGGWEMTPHRQIHPEAHQPLPLYVPASIRDSHDEAARCAAISAYTAATLMARRGVEAICAEQGQATGTLASKLTALKEAGTIDERLHDWSAVVRNLGNSGAHDVEQPLSREDAEDAIAFFEALVNHLYTFKQRYETHRRRKDTEKGLRELI